MIVPMFWLALAVAESAGGGEIAVAELSHRLDATIATGDVAAAATLYCDDFLLTSSAGRTKTKAEMLADIGNRSLRFEINRTDSVSIRQLGGVAVLTGVLHQKGQIGERTFDHRLRVTDTWVQSGALGWCLFAGHASDIGQ
jgi:ketosteroid isomerase-like protein